MKKVIFFVGIAAAVALASCTKNEITPTQTETFTGDKAYIVVKIKDVGSISTRATGSDTYDGFETGQPAEYAINDAHFYFYDSYGDYVASTDVTSGITGATNSTNNIDYDTYSIIILKDLKNKSYPNWVVTVLNQPSDFTAPETTIDALYEALASSSSEGYEITSGSTTYYTMSTSSFVGADDNTEGYSTASDDPAYYYATHISPDNISLQELTSDGNNGFVDAENNAVEPVNIYVERLAAKVIVKSSLTGATSNGRYVVSANTIDKDGNESSESYYISLDGWALNATTRQSNIVKHIQSTNTWTDTYFGFGSDYSFDWNDATHYRSYWGESYNYGLGTDIGSSEGNDDSAEGVESTWLNQYLKYTSLLDDNLTYIGTEYCDYCAENTNTAGTGNLITRTNSSVITSVLVRATVYADDSSEDGLDLVSLNGVLYTKDNYLALALSHLGTTYYTDAEGTTAMSTSDLDLEDIMDGKVKVVVSGDYAGTGFYALNSDGTVSETETTVEDMNTLLESHFNDTYGDDANGFNGGQMYYNVPIQHLNNDYSQTDADGNVKILEANYGVVRNHVYYLDIKTLTNFGRGIYDPQEVIVPQKEEDTYALTADIHVLSWKVVNQSVDL